MRHSLALPALCVSLCGCLCLCAAAAAGCAHLATAQLARLSPGGEPDGLPDRAELATGQLVIHADFPLSEKHRMVRDLESLRLDVSQELGLPVSDEPIHLYLFQSPARYESFVASRFPAFPTRRAFFLQTDTTLSVFAPWQDRIAEDLRHETTHGYVHAVVPTVPLWLDEGISEYFELPRGEHGRHEDHIAQLAGRLLEGTWRIDLLRLESLQSAGELTQDHYAEAWLWVHWMLHSSPARRKVLQDYLADLRRDGQTAPLSVRLTHLDGPQVECEAKVRVHLSSLAPL